MRRVFAFVLAFTFASGPALAATADNGIKPPHSHAFHKAKAKTTGHPLASSPANPNAGTSEQGTPNTNVTNGGELAH